MAGKGEVCSHRVPPQLGRRPDATVQHERVSALACALRTDALRSKHVVRRARLVVYDNNVTGSDEHTSCASL
jgi:hypothetical protein